MSHKSVETVIGKLVTDEAFRRKFAADPAAALKGLGQRDAELTPVEIEALLAIDPAAIHSFAEAIDRRLQKMDLGARCEQPEHERATGMDEIFDVLIRHGYVVVFGWSSPSRSGCPFRPSRSCSPPAPWPAAVT